MPAARPSKGPTPHSRKATSSRKAPSSRKASSSRKATPTRKPAQARAGFQRTRAARANEVAQDYAEAIAELSDAVGIARVVDLARLLGVSHVTVVRTVARLRRAGIVDRERVPGLRLTPAGQRIASDARKRHEAARQQCIPLGHCH